MMGKSRKSWQVAKEAFLKVKVYRIEMEKILRVEKCGEIDLKKFEWDDFGKHCRERMKTEEIE